jgi:hypothetical protein
MHGGNVYGLPNGSLPNLPKFDLFLNKKVIAAVIKCFKIDIFLHF